MNLALDVLGQFKSKSVFTALLIALASVGLDALSKAWAQAALPPSGAVAVVGDVLRFDLGYNTGVAFGLFANTGWPLAVLISAGILGLLAWVFVSLKTGLPPRRALPLGLILGGAIANLVDRVVDGKVTDFIDVGLGATRWPTFNLADSFIIIGILVLLWDTLATQEHADNVEHASREDNKSA